MTNTHIKLADVAKAAGVSQGTASNVFSRPEVVRAEVREHVLTVARSLGYNGPDVKGRLLRAGRVNAIGVAAVEPLAYFFDDPWARSLMTALGAACDATGTGIALISARNQQNLAWNVNSALVDGFILLCVEGGEHLVELTRRRQLPFVALALGDEDLSIPTIGIDNICGARKAAQHLLDLGHRRFAMLATGYSNSPLGSILPNAAEPGMGTSSWDRVRGYWQALEAAGLRRADVPLHATQNDAPSVNAALEAIFSASQPPTAILAMSDRIGILTMAWLSRRGLSVPRDVSVIGFDGVPESAIAGLTTVVQPFDDIAGRAASAVLDGVVPIASDVLDLALVVRGSTAAPF